MKTIILSVFALIYASSFSQTQFYQLNYIYDLVKVDPDSVSYSDSIDINQDGVVDMSIKSWFGHNNGLSTVLEVKIHGSDSFYGATTNECGYMKECSDVSTGFLGHVGYLYNSESENCHNLEGERSFPFKFMGGSGPLNAAIYVSFDFNLVTVLGVGWHLITDGAYDCSQTLGAVGQFQTTGKDMSFKYYNMLGQEVFEKKGILLEVSSIGTVNRVYFD